MVPSKQDCVFAVHFKVLHFTVSVQACSYFLAIGLLVTESTRINQNAYS